MGKPHALVVVVLVVAERPGAVAFVVGFVYDIESELITDLVEIGHIRIMAGTNSVEIVLFDHVEILLDPGPALHFTRDRIRFVPVHTAEFDRSSVQVHDTILQADTAETDALGDGLVFRLNDQCVEVRCLSIPEQWILDSELYFRLSVQGGFENRLGCAAGFRRLGICAAVSRSFEICAAVFRGFKKLQSDRDRLSAVCELYAEIRRAEIFRQICGDDIIRDAVLRTIQKVYITDNT